MLTSVVIEIGPLEIFYDDLFLWGVKIKLLYPGRGFGIRIVTSSSFLSFVLLLWINFHKQVLWNFMGSFQVFGIFMDFQLQGSQDYQKKKLQGS